MPRLSINPADWSSALKWADNNSKALGLYLGADRRDILTLVGSGTKTKQTIGLQYGAAQGPDAFSNPDDPPGLTLRRVAFMVKAPNSDDFIVAGWSPDYADVRELPDTLEELIQTDEVLVQKPTQRAYLLKVAQHQKGFRTAYTEIYKILHPTLQHWELTSAPEEDYLESITEAAGDEPVIAPEDWDAAKEWISTHHRAFKVEWERVLSGHSLALYKALNQRREIFLQFTHRSRRSKEDPYILSRIGFEIPEQDGMRRLAEWAPSKGDEKEPPATLDELIAGDESLTVTLRKAIGQMANRHKEFKELYANIYERLFPKRQHWELTGAPEEDYLENLARDTDLMRRLTNGLKS